jgi:hypothetical protein
VRQSPPPFPLPPVHPGRRRCCHSTGKSKPPPPLQPLTVISHLRPSSSSAIDPSSLPVPSSCYRTHQTPPSTTGAQCHRETPPTTGARCRCETPLSRRCKPPRRCPVGPMSLTPPHLARCLLGDPPVLTGKTSSPVEHHSATGYIPG